jgi:hypothetical protein
LETPPPLVTAKERTKVWSAVAQGCTNNLPGKPTLTAEHVRKRVAALVGFLEAGTLRSAHDGAASADEVAERERLVQSYVSWVKNKV